MVKAVIVVLLCIVGLVIGCWYVDRKVLSESYEAELKSTRNAGKLLAAMNERLSREVQEAKNTSAKTRNVYTTRRSPIVINMEEGTLTVPELPEPIKVPESVIQTIQAADTAIAACSLLELTCAQRDSMATALDSVRVAEIDLLNKRLTQSNRKALLRNIEIGGVFLGLGYILGRIF